MSTATVPEAPPTSPPAPPPDGIPRQTPAYTYAPRETDAPKRQRQGGVLGGLILIALGIVALGGVWFPGQGAWLFIGLGTAFLIARVLTGRCGYAVPAGILLAFGSYVWCTETRILNGPQAGGMFFVFLGLGFIATYAIAARPAVVWPVFPGVLLIGFGTFIQATTVGVPFGQYWWLAQYWPLALVGVGAWLLLRDRLPAAARTPVAIVGASSLILIGLLVAAAGMSMVATPYSRAPISMPMPWTMPWPMFQGGPTFGNPPLQDTNSLSSPAGSAELVSLVNTSGSTVVRATGGPEVRVQATRHYWTGNQPPEVRLIPANGVLTVEATAAGFYPGPGTTGYIDYVVDMPSALGADVRSASGPISVTGLSGLVRIETASGSVDLRDTQGPAVVTSISGGIRMTNVVGDLRVASTSGGIYGAGLARVSDARSMSGGINLTGDFATDAQIVTVSGGVSLRLTPAASLHVDAASVSGDINANDVALIARQAGPHSLSGNVGAGATTLSVRTTSGSISLQRGS